MAAKVTAGYFFLMERHECSTLTYRHGGLCLHRKRQMANLAICRFKAGENGESRDLSEASCTNLLPRLRVHLKWAWQTTTMLSLAIFGGNFSNFSQGLWRVSVIIGWLFGCRQTDPTKSTGSQQWSKPAVFLCECWSFSGRGRHLHREADCRSLRELRCFVPLFVARSGAVLAWNVIAELFALSRLKIRAETET